MLFLRVALIVICFVTLMLEGKATFPEDFAWGAATASYQIEGAWNVSRGPTVWDTFSHTPGKTANGDTGDLADDSYHKYPEDIALALKVGISHYRFSIAWSRIMLNGRGDVNKEGVIFYNNLIDALLEAKLTPFVTLFHWDTPQALEDSEHGWLNDTMVPLFAAYADACFERFGDRVKYWTTLNEPFTVVQNGYASGVHAPGRCSNRAVCAEGNSSTEPYIVGHNLLNAHAAAVNVYRTKYEKEQRGRIGVTINSNWAEPLTNSVEDVAAAQRALLFEAGWFSDPVFMGDYPDVMRELLGDRLPRFTSEQSALLKGSHDFYALNHYTSDYVYHDPNGGADDQAGVTFVRDGVAIGDRAASDWLYVVPWGFRKMLNWVADRYDNPPLYVTENGCDAPGESAMSREDALNDTFRVNYFQEYVHNMALAREQDGVNVVGYFMWSLLDNFEWNDGYNMRFGVHYVDYKDPNRARFPKLSAQWWTQFLVAQRVRAAKEEGAIIPFLWHWV